LRDIVSRALTATEAWNAPRIDHLDLGSLHAKKPRLMAKLNDLMHKAKLLRDALEDLEMEASVLLI
jgi:hypothetical protein